MKFVYVPTPTSLQLKRNKVGTVFFLVKIILGT